jgi:hypothetical protein
MIAPRSITVSHFLVPKRFEYVPDYSEIPGVQVRTEVLAVLEPCELVKW